jgi:hypothetical protein
MHKQGCPAPEGCAAPQDLFADPIAQEPIEAGRRDGCHVATHGITEPGGRKYDWPFAVQPGAKFQFPGPVLGPFWPNINAARRVTHRSKEVTLFVGLILGYATLAGVTTTVIRRETEAAEGKKERPVRRAGW